MSNTIQLNIGNLYPDIFQYLGYATTNPDPIRSVCPHRTDSILIGQEASLRELLGKLHIPLKDRSLPLPSNVELFMHLLRDEERSAPLKEGLTTNELKMIDILEQLAQFSLRASFHPSQELIQQLDTSGFRVVTSALLTLAPTQDRPFLHQCIKTYTVAKMIRPEGQEELLREIRASFPSISRLYKMKYSHFVLQLIKMCLDRQELEKAFSLATHLDELRRLSLLEQYSSTSDKATNNVWSWVVYELFMQGHLSLASFIVDTTGCLFDLSWLQHHLEQGHFEESRDFFIEHCQSSNYQGLSSAIFELYPHFASYPIEKHLMQQTLARGEIEIAKQLFNCIYQRERKYHNHNDALDLTLAVSFGGRNTRVNSIPMPDPLIAQNTKRFLSELSEEFTVTPSFQNYTEKLNASLIA